MAPPSDPPDSAPASRRGAEAGPAQGARRGLPTPRADRPVRRSRFNDVSLLALIGLILAGFLSLAIIALT